MLTSAISWIDPNLSGTFRNFSSNAPKNGTATVEPRPKLQFESQLIQVNLEDNKKNQKKQSKQSKSQPENAAARGKAFAVGKPAHERGHRRHVRPRERHAPHCAAGVEQRQTLCGKRCGRQCKPAASPNQKNQRTHNQQPTKQTTNSTQIPMWDWFVLVWDKSKYPPSESAPSIHEARGPHWSRNLPTNAPHTKPPITKLNVTDVWLRENWKKVLLTSLCIPI